MPSASSRPNRLASWPALVKRIEPVALHLAMDGERGSLRDVTFRVPKDVVAKAEHVGLGVTDEHFF